MTQKHLDASFAQQLQRLVLALVRESLRGQEPIPRVDERDVEMWPYHLELGGHLNAHGAAADHNYAMLGVGHGVDVLLYLKQVLLPSQRLWHNRLGTAQSCRRDKVVVVVRRDNPGDFVDCGGRPRGAVDIVDGAADEFDLWCCEACEVLKVDPCLAGIFFVC
ncbi:hypothetical protein E4U43_001927 [Claviceps pusilla]|uniref:Uncharacterized protein n=1 Tax=Claviceps pusilla TaxID=123648 RepID=A0A9P7NID6_9HYPO|nr:hypothetical protein E4U43_001927 [Claviceps pusilla]